MIAFVFLGVSPLLFSSAIKLSLSPPTNFVTFVFPVFSPHPAGDDEGEQAAVWVLGCCLGSTHCLSPS